MVDLERLRRSLAQATYEDPIEGIRRRAAVAAVLRPGGPRGPEALFIKRVEREGAVTYPADAEDKPGNEILFAAGFPTESGRGKLVPTDIVPPDELPDDRFPMVLSTGRVLEHWHTGAMTRRASVLDAIEPEAVACLSPADLRRLAIAPGDTIRVSTRRGAIELKARADASLQPGLVFIPFCYAEAAANILTNPQLDPFGKIPEFKYCAAKVEPVSSKVAAE